MYLTRIEVDPYTRNARGLLSNSYIMHQALCNLVDSPREKAGLLYRMVRMPDRTVIYVYTSEPLSREKFGPGLAFDSATDLSMLTDALTPGQVLAFDVLAVPSKKIASTGKNSRRVILRDQDTRLAWLKRKLSDGGFDLLSVEEKNPVDTTARKGRTKNTFHLRGYHYTGFLSVTDPEKARATLSGGVGPERAFGYGMLMVRPV